MTLWCHAGRAAQGRRVDAAPMKAEAFKTVQKQHFCRGINIIFQSDVSEQLVLTLPSSVLFFFCCLFFFLQLNKSDVSTLTRTNLTPEAFLLRRRFCF